MGSIANMATLKALAAARCGIFQLRAAAKQGINSSSRKTNGLLVPVRHGGGPRKIDMEPSRYEWTQMKDDLHLFFTMGLLPLGLLITYVNLVHGEAELADIPEDYEPKYWEYYKHPISRFLSKYIYGPPERDYEKMLHYLNVETNKRQLREWEKEIKAVMAEKGDAKGWYYYPTNHQSVYRSREVLDDFEKMKGPAE